MRLAMILTGALFAASLAPGLVAQDIPDFGGTWNREGPAPAQAAGAGIAGLGTTATITQTDSTITLSRTSQFGQLSSVYNLDGSSRSSTLNIGEFSVPQNSTATWADGALLLTTSMEYNGNYFEISVKLSLDAEGKLTAVVTTPGFQGGGPAQDTATYTKG